MGMNLAECFRRWVQWLRRCGHRRGFGIQSPFAYRMVTEVLCQPLPYHLYDDLAALMPHVEGRMLKVCRMLLRLANECQARETFVAGGLPREYRAYVLAGNRRTRFAEHMEACCLVLLSASDDNLLTEALNGAHEDLVLVVLDIYRRGVETMQWRQVKGHESVTATFDLLDVGVAFFSQKLPRKHYQMNL